MDSSRKFTKKILIVKNNIIGEIKALSKIPTLAHKDWQIKIKEIEILKEIHFSKRAKFLQSKTKKHGQLLKPQ